MTSNGSPSATPMACVPSQAFPGASHAPTKQPKTSKAQKPKVPFHQGSLQNLAKQPKGNTCEPLPSFHLDPYPFPPEQQLAPGPQAPLLIPKTTDTCLAEDYPATLQPMDQPPVPRKSLHPAKGPPTKLSSVAAKKPKGKTQHQSEKKQPKETGFSLKLVLCCPDASARKTPAHLPIPEATEVTITHHL